MKIALLDAHNSRYDEIASLSSPRKAKYCRKHGYDFIEYKFTKIERKANWGRVLALSQYLKNYDWILYLDTDIILNNLNVKIEDQIGTTKLVVSRMPNGNNVETHVSTSAILIKNCEWSFRFLDQWWNHHKNEYYSQGPATNGDGGYFFEQSAFHYLYENVTEHAENIEIRDRWFNSRYQFCGENDVLAHFARPGDLRGDEPYDKAGLMKKFLKERVRLL